MNGLNGIEGIEGIPLKGWAGKGKEAVNYGASGLRALSGMESPFFSKKYLPFLALSSMPSYLSRGGDVEISKSELKRGI